MAEKSYTSATSDTPLLGDTIGENLDRTVARYPDRLALVDLPAGIRLSYAGAERRSRRARPRPPRRGHQQGRPRRDLGAELRRVDPHPVRHRQDRRDPGQHQPRLPDQRARVRAQPVRLQAARRRPETEDLRLRRDDRRGPPALRRPGAGRPARHRGMARPPRDRQEGRRRRQLDAIELSADEPINIQYTSGTTGFPKGATLSHHNILNNGFFVGELCRYTAEDKICIPVPFYHCFGMVMGNLAATTHGAAMIIPAPSFDPVKTLEAVAAGALHVALRRPDDVHRRARGRRLRAIRPQQPAHRHHGGLALPGRGDEAGHRPDGHVRGVDLLRHDRDLPGLHPDPGTTTPSSAGSPPSARSARTSRSRSSTPRPASPPRATPPASSAPAATA